MHYRFEIISPEEHNAFNNTHPQGNFQQSVAMGRRRLSDGIEVTYLGVRDGESLVASALFELYRSRLSTYAKIHDGPLVDFHDTELVTFFMNELKAYARKAGAAQLEITPEKPYAVRDTNGCLLPEPATQKPWPSGVPVDAPHGTDDQSIKTLKALGFEHGGLTTGYGAVARWRYLKDLTGIADEQALLASYLKNTKRNVRIAHESGVCVERIGRDSLKTFHSICEFSCEKQGFQNRPLAYFESIFDAFGEAAEFIVAFIDTRAYLASWEEKRDEFQADIERFERSLESSRSPERIQKKLADTQKKHEAALKRVDGAQAYLKTYGERIPAAAALFIWHPRECVYLFSGSDPKFAKFYAATAIQHHIMLECLDRGITRYNFYGINGVFDDPDDPGRGLLEFKQGFSGYVEEMLGEFTLPVKPVTFAAKKLAHKILGR